MKRVIVTGASGFVGMNLVELLQKRKYFVYAIIRPNSIQGNRIVENEFLKKIELNQFEIERLPDLIKNKCTYFFHLAWEGAHNDFYFQYKNIMPAVKAVDVAINIGCQRFICTGSQAEYGIQNKLITEQTLPNPNTAYGAAKLSAAYLTKQRARDVDIDWVWGRIFSLYGKYEPKGTMLSYLVESLKQNKQPKLTGATQNWDYLYSEDGAKALLALAEFGKNAEIYNIANGNYNPLKVYTELVKNKIAPNIEVDYSKLSNTIVSLQPSVEKIYRDTGWKAETTFGDGIAAAYHIK